MVSSIGFNRWEELVEASKVPVLVEFVTQTCPNCAAMAPAVEEMESRYEGRIKVYRVDVQQEQSIAMRYGIMGVPTFKFFCKGQPVSELVGEVYPALLTKMVEQTLESGAKCVETSTRISYEMSGYG